MPIKLMRWIDYYVGVPLCYFLGVLLRIECVFRGLKKDRPVTRILVIKFLGIGSIILTQPALLALRRSFPGAHITYLTFQKNKEVFSLLDLGDRHWFIDTKNPIRFVLSTLRVIVAARKARFDLALDFEFFAKFPIIITTLGGVWRTAGFYIRTEPWRKPLLHYRGYYNHYFHVKDIFLSLTYLVSENDPYYQHFEAWRTQFARPAFSRSFKNAPRTLKKHWSARRDLDLLIMINPNAGPDLAPTLKRWPAEHFRELMIRLYAKFPNTHFMCTGSRSEREYVESIRKSALSEIPEDRIQNIAGSTSLMELMAIFKHAHLLVTVDSGPMHMAALVGTPTIGIFGAETPILYAPLGDRARALAPALYSVPMFNVYNGKESELEANIPVRLISVDQVFDNALELLGYALHSKN